MHIKNNNNNNNIISYVYRFSFSVFFLRAPESGAHFNIHVLLVFICKRMYRIVNKVNSKTRAHTQADARTYIHFVKAITRIQNKNVKNMRRGKKIITFCLPNKSALLL